MRTKLLYLFVILFSVQSFGQRKYAAAQYFKQFAYTKSADLYTQIYKKGDSSKLVLERLGDSYYFNTNAQEAEKWYGKLINNFKDEVSSEYYFRYAQTLKSNGDYEKSDEIMKQFRSMQTTDSRSAALNTSPDYAVLYSSTEGKKINLHNLSTNTEYSDFGGFREGSTYYFSSSKPKQSSRNRIYKWNNQPFLDIYSATIETKTTDDIAEDKIIELVDVKALNKEINTRYHEANAIVTKDGLTMYFTRDNFDGRRKGKDKNRTTHLKLYKATLLNGVWENVVELPFNSDDYSIGHPALSPDEKTLYFVSDMPGGIGGTDIYKVSVDGDEYGTPTNLGRTINTEGREMFPFVSANNVLYFSSDGHLGLGALDIFESTIYNGEFSKVKNIKAPFNSKLDDFGFYIGKNKKQGFLSSNREGGKGDDDVYSFLIEEQPCLQNIIGTVTDSKINQKIPNATVKLIDAEGKVIATKQTDVNGAFSFENVKCSTSFSLVGEKKNYKPDNKETKTTDKTGENQNVDLNLTPLIVNGEIVINPIFFDFNKSNIREEAAYELENVVSVMKNNPDMVIKIESHTDSRGKKSYNRKLSDRRAKSTRDYIVSRGIAYNRIQSAIGYGEDQLLNHCDDANRNNCTEEEHQRNRRSKFIIVSGNKNDVKVNNPNSVQLKKVDPKPGRN